MIEIIETNRILLNKFLFFLLKTAKVIHNAARPKYAPPCMILSLIPKSFTGVSARFIRDKYKIAIV